MPKTADEIATDVESPTAAARAAAAEETVKSEDELLKKVEDRLDALGDDPSPTLDEPAASEDTDTPPETPAAEDTDVDAEPEPDKTDDKEDAEEKDTEVIVPEAYRRTAINQGWTEKDIAEQFKANPELTLKTLGRIHDSTNSLNVKFAEIGRKSMDKPAPAVKSEEKPVDNKPTVDFSKLEEAYKDDPIVDTIKSIAQANEDLKIELSELKLKASEAPPVSKAEQEALVSEISGFFSSDQTKFYEEFYGKSEGNNWDSLTGGQFDNRSKVMVVADQIAAGKALQGDDITNAEAMEAAHTIVSSEFLKKAVEIGIKATLKKREAGITFKPDSQARKQDEQDGKPKTQAKIESRAQERLDKLFK